MKKIRENLTKLQQNFQSMHLSDFFNTDELRAKTYSLEAAGIFLDYSKNLCNTIVFEQLLELTQAAHLDQTADHVDGDADDDGAKDVAEQGVTGDRATDSSRRNVGVGHLECHADGEGEVHEVEVVRAGVVVEVDPAFRLVIVQVRVTQGEDRVDGEPRNCHGRNRNGGHPCLQASGGGLRGEQRQEHPDKADNAGKNDDEVVVDPT